VNEAQPFASVFFVAAPTITLEPEAFVVHSENQSVVGTWSH